MRDTQLYQQILGLKEPWTVTSVDLDRTAGNVLVKVEPRPDAVFSCPTCGKAAPRYDSRTRRWRHLDTCQYMTILQEASIQAVARQLRVSWSSVDRIMARAVARGMARRAAVSPRRLCVDETSFQKRHEYVTW